MTERDTELSKRLVIGHKRDGRACYDKDAKRELIEACLRSGMSVAWVALAHGINANLLRMWIPRYHQQRELGLQTPESEPQAGAVAIRSAFLPVVEVKTARKVSRARFGAQLPNGIKLDLSEVGGDDLLVCETALPFEEPSFQKSTVRKSWEGHCLLLKGAVELPILLLPTNITNNPAIACSHAAGSGTATAACPSTTEPILPE